MFNNWHEFQAKKPKVISWFSFSKMHNAQLLVSLLLGQNTFGHIWNNSLSKLWSYIQTTHVCFTTTQIQDMIDICTSSLSSLNIFQQQIGNQCHGLFLLTAFFSILYVVWQNVWHLVKYAYSISGKEFVNVIDTTLKSS